MGFCITKFPIRVCIQPCGSNNLRNIEINCRKNYEDGEKKGFKLGRKIMVVVDSSKETKVALRWALSHAVQSYDKLILLNVIKSSSKHGKTSPKRRDARSTALLYSLKIFCQARNPEVEVELSTVEGKETGPTIVQEAKRQGVSLLVLGHKKIFTAWRFFITWARHFKNAKAGVVDYCIKNSSCLTLGVRKKRRGGGYLITSRQHKDFWLLA